MAEFVEATWLPRIKARKACWKLEANKEKNHILPAFGSKSLASITESDVRRWLDTFERQQCALSTRNRRLHVLKTIFTLAVEHGVLPADPSRHVQSRHVKKNHWPSLDDAHVASLLSALHFHSDRKAKAIELIMLTGAQKREILNARWEDLFLDEGILLAQRGSGPSARKIRLYNAARSIFRSLPRKGGSPWIFPGRDGRAPLSDIFHFWNALRNQLGLGDISIRDLHHVFVEWQFRLGISPLTLHRVPGMADMQRGSDMGPAPLWGCALADLPHHANLACHCVYSTAYSGATQK
ncbi:MAG: hypothetical protein HDQ90_09385 [Desulfovibrio sp.]|nr:hypothetical protein [Desulfovibrio sp.]